MWFLGENFEFWTHMGYILAKKDLEKNLGPKFFQKKFLNFFLLFNSVFGRKFPPFAPTVPKAPQAPMAKASKAKGATGCVIVPTLLWVRACLRAQLY